MSSQISRAEYEQRFGSANSMESMDRDQFVEGLVVPAYKQMYASLRKEGYEHEYATVATRAALGLDGPDIDYVLPESRPVTRIAQPNQQRRAELDSLRQEIEKAHRQPQGTPMSHEEKLQKVREILASQATPINHYREPRSTFAVDPMATVQQLPGGRAMVSKQRMAGAALAAALLGGGGLVLAQQGQGSEA